MITKDVQGDPGRGPSGRPLGAGRASGCSTEALCVDRSQQESWRVAFERGATTWTDVRLAYGDFLQHTQKLRHPEAPSHAAELYLAAACQLGCAVALRVLDHQYIQPLQGVVLRVVRDPGLLDDVLQDLRRRLLVGPAPRIACYRGVGSLKGWIRAIGVNIAKDHLRSDGSRRRRDAGQSCLLFIGAGDAWAEEDVIANWVRRDWLGAFKEAFQHSFEALDANERLLLQDHFIRGLSIDLLAPRYGVNRATVARKIRRLTCWIRQRVRKHLACSYPREDRQALDAIALAASCDSSVDPLVWLAPPVGCWRA